MEVKINRAGPKVPMPVYATGGAGCFDLHAYLPDLIKVYVGETGYTFRTGLKFEVPAGHVMLIFSRSGHGFKNQVRLSNCVGVIDSDYRGEVQVQLIADNDDPKQDLTELKNVLEVKNGDRIAQAMIIPIPSVRFVEADLSETERGEGGFGSTGSGNVVQGGTVHLKMSGHRATPSFVEPGY
jgi:dUTP pyrophosphatase